MATTPTSRPHVLSTPRNIDRAMTSFLRLREAIRRASGDCRHVWASPWRSTAEERLMVRPAHLQVLLPPPRRRRTPTLHGYCSLSSPLHLRCLNLSTPLGSHSAPPSLPPLRDCHVTVTLMKNISATSDARGSGERSFRFRRRIDFTPLHMRRRRATPHPPSARCQVSSAPPCGDYEAPRSSLEAIWPRS